MNTKLSKSHLLPILFSTLIFFLGNFSLWAEKFDHNHKVFDVVLNKIVKNGKVNYKELKKNPEALQSYLKSLSSVSESEFQKFTEKEQLAFLVNAYNAFTLDLILQHYPVESIGDIGGPVRSINLLRGTPWKKFSFPLLGGKKTLDWIEHGKLRKDYNEPRIHFAINCASIGCPLLLPSAYTAKKWDSQILQSTKGFLKERSKNRYDSKSNTLYLSKIFDWFKEDFEKDSGLVINFVNKYYDVKIPGDAKISYTNYDWNLNEAK